MSETQPQPGNWYMVNTMGPFYYIGPDLDGDPTFQKDARFTMGSYADPTLRHLPNCTGFDYEVPPEQTPAEKRLPEVGVTWCEGDRQYRNPHKDVLRLVDWKSDQLEAIAAHMREWEGAD